MRNYTYDKQNQLTSEYDISVGTTGYTYGNIRTKVNASLVGSVRESFAYTYANPV